MNLTESELQEMLKNPDVKVDKMHSQVVREEKAKLALPLIPEREIEKHYSPVEQGKAQKESEGDFATWFEDFLHRLGYKFMHVRPARVIRDGKEVYETPFSGDGKGWEDYFVWHEDKRFYFLAELKSDTGSLSEAQKAIIESHQKAGLPVFVWRPRDRTEIERLLV